MLIAVGIPNGNNGNNEMMGTLAVLAHEIGRRGYAMAYLGRCSVSIDLNRNEIMQAAKDIQADYLLMIDTDLELQQDKDIIQHLLSLNKDIITGIYFQGEYPYRPVIYNFGETGITNFVDIPNELFRVEAAGGGFIFMSKKVIQHFNSNVYGECPFDLLYNPRFLREDAAFFWRCKQAGFETWADPTLRLTHWKRQGITQQYWQLAKSQILASNKHKESGIDGFMSEGELIFLKHRASQMQTVVEIGSWKGRSTKALLESGAEVIAIDHWKGSDTIKEIAEKNDIFADFIRNVGHYPNLKVMKMPSLEAVSKLNGDSFDMVFIDGSHAYDDVKSDIEAWMPRTKKLICGHDYAPAWPGVMRAVQEQFSDFNVHETIWWVEVK